MALELPTPFGHESGAGGGRCFPQVGYWALDRDFTHGYLIGFAVDRAAAVLIPVGGDQLANPELRSVGRWKAFVVPLGERPPWGNGASAYDGRGRKLGNIHRFAKLDGCPYRGPWDGLMDRRWAEPKPRCARG